MSGWRIVPVEASDKQLESARDWSYVKYGQSIGNDAANGCWRCMVAAAPEPDWEALANVAYDAEAEAFAECVANGTVMQHGQHYARRISILAALRATFGSKP